MRSFIAVIASGLGALFLGSAAPPSAASRSPTPSPADHAALAAPGGAFSDTSPRAAFDEGASLLASLPPPIPTAEEALKDGVLIIVSLKSQQLFVFRDGQPWGSSKVSTGRRGHETPTGEFPILQKKVHHRSSLYNDAPMPYMQRLTWDGVALHAGALPGYAASHGCIRLPKGFAQDLYKITDFTSSVVVVTDAPVASPEAARKVVWAREAAEAERRKLERLKGTERPAEPGRAERNQKTRVTEPGRKLERVKGIEPSS